MQKIAEERMRDEKALLDRLMQTSKQRSYIRLRESSINNQ
jgi:hypothetical protein